MWPELKVAPWKSCEAPALGTSSPSKAAAKWGCYQSCQYSVVFFELVPTHETVPILTYFVIPWPLSPLSFLGILHSVADPHIFVRLSLIQESQPKKTCHLANIKILLFLPPSFWELF